MAFAQYMGKPIEYPFREGHRGLSEGHRGEEAEHERQNFRRHLAFRHRYLAEPPMGSMLLAREVPPHGATPSSPASTPLTKRCPKACGGFSMISRRSMHLQRPMPLELAKTSPGKKEIVAEYVAEHPVVRTHRKRAARRLYVNVGHTVRFSA